MSTYVKVYVDHPHVNCLYLSRENNPNGPAWKSDGFKGEDPYFPADLWYERFDEFLAHVSNFIDKSARWTDGESDQELTAWEAIAFLTCRPNR